MSNTTFYAKVRLTGPSPETVLLTFSSVAKADQWWEIIQKTNWPGDLKLNKDTAKRTNPQWFTWPNGNQGAQGVMRVISNHEAMKPLQADFDWTPYAEGKDPVIPIQDAQGKSTADTSALDKKIADLEARLKAAEGGSGSGSDSTAVATTGSGSGALVSITEGQNWRGGARFQGGPQHYAMASDAFKMALDCKDRGDDRSFNMIFSQLFMEQRRTVGVAEKVQPEGGYNSFKLIEHIHAQAKLLQAQGDDRPFGLIFGSLSMAYRRGATKW